MTCADSVRWVYARTDRDEILARVVVPIDGLRIHLPIVGPVRFRMNRGVKKMRWQATMPLKNIFDLEEGEILSRLSGKIAPAAKPRRWPLMIGVLFSVMSIGLASFPPHRRSVKNQGRAIVVARATPLPLPSVVPTEKEIKLSAPRKKNVKRKVLSMQVETRARERFLKGDLFQAVFELSELKSRRDEHFSPRMSTLYSEIEYAICRRALEKEEWKTAVEHCGRAVKENSHPRAAKVLSRLASRTRRLYLEGYVMEGLNSEAAVKRYREALLSAAPGDPYGEKAGRKMKAIEGVSPH